MKLMVSLMKNALNLWGVNNMSSSPYELRLNVLNLAKNILERKQEIEIQNQSTTNINSASVATSLALSAPIQPYTTDDVISEANKLYDFVNNKDRK